MPDYVDIEIDHEALVSYVLSSRLGPEELRKVFRVLDRAGQPTGNGEIVSLPAGGPALRITLGERGLVMW